MKSINRNTSKNSLKTCPNSFDFVFESNRLESSLHQYDAYAHTDSLHCASITPLKTITPLMTKPVITSMVSSLPITKLW